MVAQKSDEVRKEYVTQNYRAWVSKYNVALDSIDVFSEDRLYNKENTCPLLGIGLSVGYGAGRSGLSPYVEVGVYYRIW